MSAGFRQKRARKPSSSPNQGFIQTGARAESATRVRMSAGFKQERARNHHRVRIKGSFGQKPEQKAQPESE